MDVKHRKCGLIRQGGGHLEGKRRATMDWKKTRANDNKKNMIEETGSARDRSTAMAEAETFGLGITWL